MTQAAVSAEKGVFVSPDGSISLNSEGLKLFHSHGYNFLNNEALAVMAELLKKRRSAEIYQEKKARAARRRARRERYKSSGSKSPVS